MMNANFNIISVSIYLYTLSVLGIHNARILRETVWWEKNLHLHECVFSNYVYTYEVVGKI